MALGACLRQPRVSQNGLGLEAGLTTAIVLHWQKSIVSCRVNIGFGFTMLGMRSEYMPVARLDNDMKWKLNLLRFWWLGSPVCAIAKFQIAFTQEDLL